MNRIVRTEEVTDPVTAVVGDLLEVRLVQNAGTGYQWEPAEVPGNLTPAGDETETGSLRMPGAAALRVLTFSLDAAGEGTLVVVLKRGWESEPLRAASWSVVVGAERAEPSEDADDVEQTEA